MAAVELGGASAGERTQVEEPEQPAVRPEPLELNFVAENVAAEAWGAWGERFSGIDDLVARIRERLQHGQQVRRLVLAGYSADHTSGYMAFDAGITSRERIDGLNQNPIRPEVAAKLRQLTPLMDPDGVVELRVCGVGHGDHGRKALQAFADVVGVATRGPCEKALALAPNLGFVGDWLTVFPAAKNLAPVRSSWVETAVGGAAGAQLVYVPVPGEPPPTAMVTGEAAVTFVTPTAAGWPGEAVSGITQLADLAAVAAGSGKLKRLAVVSLGSPLYDGFVAFDAGGGESVDGSIREQGGFAHLEVVYPHVRVELERLRRSLDPDALVELRVARLGAGESGRRALQALADALGVPVRAPANTLGELKVNRGLVTRWCTAWPGSAGRPPLISAWCEISEPAPSVPWVPVEAAAFAPIRAVVPPLPAREVADPPAPAPPPPQAVAAAELVVLCGGCGRILDEPPATPTRARRPCPRCGSLVRERRLEPARASRQSGGRLRRWLRLPARERPALN